MRGKIMKRKYMGLIGLICFGLIVTPIAAENEISSNDTNQTTVNGSQTPVENDSTVNEGKDNAKVTDSPAMTDDIPAKTDGVASNIADDNNSTSTDNDSNIWANAPYRNYEDPI